MLSLIVAMAENHVIGRDNALPWRLPADLRHFRRLTMGHAIIMGRKNFESIGRPLPGRTNIVVTRARDFHAPGCQVVHSIDEALAVTSGDSEPFIIGGSEIYAQTLSQVQKIYLTLVHAEPIGDVHFPAFTWNEWRESARERHEVDIEHSLAFSFVTLERAA